MLPPTVTQAEMDRLENKKWYCNMNVYDPARSTCKAKERDQAYMSEFFLAQRNELRALSASAGMKSSSTTSTTATTTAPAQESAPSATNPTETVDREHDMNTEKDVILKQLLKIKEPKSRGRSGSDNHKVMDVDFEAEAKSLVTKFYFHDSLMEESTSEGTGNGEAIGSLEK